MHIGLIIDGNRRWAKEQGKTKFTGHKRGVENLEKIVKICSKKNNIKVLSVFTLSTENMQRDEKELKNLFRLLELFAAKWRDFVKNNVQVRFFGSLKELPLSCQKALQKLQEKTAGCDGLIFCPAINYGSKDEIIRAFNKLATEKKSKITAEDLEKYLDSAGLPPVDLLIRTGGKKRLSNFMLWQSAYAELYFFDKMWPDFTEEDLEQAIIYYQQVQRNFGK